MPTGTTDVIVVLFGDVQVLILLLMAIGSGSAKTLGANLTILVGILSIPGPFLEFKDFRMVLICVGVIVEPQLEKGIEMEVGCKFMFLWISTILGCLFKLELKTPFWLLDPITNSTFSGLMP